MILAMKVHACIMENVRKRQKFWNKLKSQKVATPFSTVQFWCKMWPVIVRLNILEIGVRVKRIHVFQILAKGVVDNVSNRVTHSGKKSPFFLQLNEYETAPYSIQFSQNLTWDCLLISVFFPKFTWADHKIVLFWISKQFYDQLR